MILMITIKQGRKKPRVITSKLALNTATYELARKVFETEQMLNTIPGSDLRWHIDLREEPNVD